MAKRAPNTGKATIWGERSRMQADGPSWAVTYHCFQTLNRADRLRALAAMNEWHEQRCAAEAPFVQEAP